MQKVGTVADIIFTSIKHCENQKLQIFIHFWAKLQKFGDAKLFHLTVLLFAINST